MAFSRRFIRPLLRVTALIVITLFASGLALAQDVQPHVIRMASTAEPTAGLVDYVTSSGTTWVMNRMYAHAPWGLDQSLNVIPLLVDEVPSVDNGGVSNEGGKTVISFHIGDWAVWSDGVPITAADFMFVWEIAHDGVTQFQSNRMALGVDIESVVQGKTDKDVVITFASTFPDITNAAFVPLPSHVLREPYDAAIKEGKGFDTLTDWIRSPTVGDGPFIFDEWVSGSYLRLKKNPNYWKPVWADEIDINFYPDLTVLKQVMANNDADLTLSISTVQDAAELVNTYPNLEMDSVFTGTRQELYFNNGPKGNAALHDVRVRRAIGMGIDRQSMVDDLWDGETAIARSYWDGTPYYNPDLKITPYDPEGAVALLKEAGWSDDNGDGVAEAHGVDGVTDGTPLKLRSFTYSDSWGGPYQDAQLAIQDMLKDIGVEVDIQTLPFTQIGGSFTDGAIRATGDFDFIVDGWGVGVDRINQVEKYRCDDMPSADNPNGQNYSYWCSPELDKDWQVIATSLDPDARMKAVYRIQEIMNDELPTFFLVNMPTVMVRNKDLQKVARGQGSTAWYNMNEWSVEASS